MKIKYNFGLLKQLDIGFLMEDRVHGFHDILLDVKKIKDKYRFIYKDKYIEIDEFRFSNCTIEKINNVYWFIVSSTPTVSGLFLFTMHDTFGFPLEISMEICEENNIKPDENGFYILKQLQKDKSKNTFKNKNAF